ncbi:MAG: peptidase M42, partial [Akkermansiaceae bacterium]
MQLSSTADLTGLLIILRHLIREPSVVGAEDSFFRVIRRELEEMDISVERHSGLLVARGNRPDSAYLS